MIRISKSQLEAACKVPSKHAPILLLVRGLQGSGKSSFVRNVCRSYNHVETDQFFMRNGEYKFELSKLDEAHRWCQAEAEAYLQMRRNVAVSNTFVQSWEMENYILMAQRMEVRFLIVCMREFDVETLSSINQHQVPFDKILKKKNQFTFPYDGLVTCEGKYVDLRKLYYPISIGSSQADKKLIVNPLRYARIGKQDWTEG